MGEVINLPEKNARVCSVGSNRMRGKGVNSKTWCLLATIPLLRGFRG